MNFSFRKSHYPELDEPYLDGLLRKARVEPKTNAKKFEQDVLRRLRVMIGRQGISYWSPAIIGASVASLAVLALLQMLTSSSSMKPIRILNGDTAQVEQPQVQLPDASSLPIIR